MNCQKGDYLNILNPVLRSDGDKKDFHRIGVVWDHGDKLTGELFATPLNGQIVIMKPAAKPEQAPREEKKD
jgi:hypothetical protein